jgi:uncharacterized protein
MYKQLAVAAVILALLIAGSVFMANNGNPGKALVVFPGGSTINAEIAQTEEQKTVGLMFRKYLGLNEGMLFSFPNSLERTFWMKNTLIPLDMIFIAENMTVVKIHHAVPCEEEPCPFYSSGKPAKYVLEVNGNYTLAHGIKEGSKVEINGG